MMRLIVDTTTGLAVVGGKRDFGGLSAVIIGSLQVPACIGVLNGGYVEVVQEKLVEILNPQSDSECKAFRALVEALRQTNGGPDTVNSEKIRIPVSEWLAH